MKSKVVSKSFVVKQAAKKSHMPEKEMSFIYDVLMEVIHDTLKSGVGVILPHIASLGIVDTKSMVSHLTGVTIPPHKRLKFKPNVHLAIFVRTNTREYKI